MLKTVQTAKRILNFLSFGTVLAVFVLGGHAARRSQVTSARSSRQASAAPQKPQANSRSLPSSPAQKSPPPVAHKLQTVVIDPAHGGTDEGAHGSSGVLEKDVDLTLALAVRARLQQDGLNVVMTRATDRTLSFVDRAGVANAQSNAIFVSLHVGSSGPIGTAFAYYYDFSRLAGPTAPVTGGLLPWNEAQRSYEPSSRRLAQLLQVELAARFNGSPELPGAAEVYQLRSIAEPAIAVEVESVNVPDAATLDALADPLALSISRAVRSFGMVYVAEAR